VANAPLVAVNVAPSANPGTVTDAGNVSTAFVLASVTAAPPEGAGMFSAIVHVVDALEPMLFGAQANERTSTVVTRLTCVVAVLLPYVAVIVALPLYRKPEVVALKLATVAPAAMVTGDGTVTATFELVRLTVTPPLGAG
jgi:hypothetical protein